MKKYYWINLWQSRYGKPHRPTPYALDKHPIKYVMDLQNWCHNNPPEDSTELALLGWQEITKEEYEEYQKLEDS